MRAYFFVCKAQYPLYKILVLLYNIIKKMTRKKGAFFAILSHFHKYAWKKRLENFAIEDKLSKIKKRLLDKRRVRRYNVIRCGSMSPYRLGIGIKGRKIMQENRKRLLKSIYSLCFSVLTLAVALLFVVQTWSIFRSAEKSPFTAERISQHFYQIAVPVVFWMIALVVNIVLGYVYPDAKEKTKAYFTADERVKRLQKRLPKDSALRGYDKGDFVRLVVACLALAFAAASIIVSLVYLLDKNYSPVLSEPIFAENKGMGDRVLRVLVWCAGATMFLMAATIFGDIIAKKKEEKIKNEIVENAKKGIRVPIEKGEKKVAKNGETATWIVRGVIAVVGIVFVILGICNGGMGEMLFKAINICTQCIGLG